MAQPVEPLTLFKPPWTDKYAFMLPAGGFHPRWASGGPLTALLDAAGSLVAR
jgi:hypothetical protein